MKYVLIGLLLYSVCLFEGDCDTDNNEIDDQLIAPNFRLLKYQEVWNLVRNRLQDEEKMKELLKKLKKLDRAELDYKRMKQKGKYDHFKFQE